MTRDELAGKLKALGWTETLERRGQGSIWVRKGRRLWVPLYEDIYESTAQRLIEEAER